MKKFVVLSLLVICSFAFIRVSDLIDFEPVPIPPSVQRLGGDVAKGYEYLTTGDYVKGGIPYSFWLLGVGKAKTNYLNRTGRNEKLAHDYTAIESNGEILVAPNCMQCHAQVFEDSLIMGMGNTFIDFAEEEKLREKNLRKAENILKLTAPKKYSAAEPFIEVARTIGPFLHTEVQGVNPADRLAAVLAAHRDPVTFKWSKEALLDIPDQVIPTDVPAWWLLKKKNAMFYNGFGRGDFGRFLMGSNLMTVNDTAESREVDAHMPDVLAYLYSLEPPAYKKPVNNALAKKGEKVFLVSCSKCHGTYGDSVSYPNLLIPQAAIQTDSLLNFSNYSSPQFIEWFNKSWFTTGDHPARLEPFNGYIAPPLDGIWATAPYLHNGSVPTLEAMLNSMKRPRYWSRDFINPKYDYSTLGWVYKSFDKPGEPNSYNTDIPGYGNYGHYFGDKLTPDERKAVLEYLKTL
ncbi:MAG: c-type cytochrome [Chitinophagaceae bacterium]|nr:MAG: c-type cytochrome [Chitinophagaceae bacterium]